MPAPDIVLKLVEQYDRNRDAYAQGALNETQLRRQFLDPFFTALGWDVDNSRGLPPQNIEVVHEYDDVARHDKIVALVERVLDLHKRKHAAKTPNDQDRLAREIAETDAAIDKLVYEFYGLTAEEMQIVESS